MNTYLDERNTFNILNDSQYRNEHYYVSKFVV